LRMRCVWWLEARTAGTETRRTRGWKFFGGSHHIISGSTVGSWDVKNLSASPEMDVNIGYRTSESTSVSTSTPKSESRTITAPSSTQPPPSFPLPPPCSTKVLHHPPAESLITLFTFLPSPVLCFAPLYSLASFSSLASLAKNSIFELQKFDLGSLLTITGLWPLTWIYTPWLRPSLRESLAPEPYGYRQPGSI
jgi:hypothetical protein